MKLMMIVVRDEHREEILATLNERGHRATFISSTGEFLNYGSSTLLLGIQEQYVEEVISYIQSKIQNTCEDEYMSNDMHALVYTLDTCATKVPIQKEKQEKQIV